MLLFKFLHILGACLFVGNIVVSAVWKVMADRTRHTAVIQYATKLVILTDMLFTAVGAALLAGSGHLLAEDHGGVMSQPWIMQSYLLFGISGLLWIAVLVPVQKRQSQLLTNIKETDSVPEQYYALGRIWSIVGSIATLTPLPALYLMVSQGF